MHAFLAGRAVKYRHCVCRVLYDVSSAIRLGTYDREQFSAGAAYHSGRCTHTPTPSEQCMHRRPAEQCIVSNH